jgi:hypothetical protein
MPGTEQQIDASVRVRFTPAQIRIIAPGLYLLAFSAGGAPKIVSERLGHPSAAFTLEVYSHVPPHMQDAAAIKVEAPLMAP